MRAAAVSLGLVAAILVASAPASAAPGTAADRAFVAKVSQGGMFEVEAGKLAVQKASAQDVKDFAAMEVHDHTLVGDKLKALASNAYIAIESKMDPEFSGKMTKLRALSGTDFDREYMSDMGVLHPKDGAAFLQEGQRGGGPELRAFGVETHKIVQRHIGAIQAAQPS